MTDCKEITVDLNWAPPCKYVFFEHMRTANAQIRLRNASAQSDQGLHCPLTELSDTAESMNGGQMPGLTRLNLASHKRDIGKQCRPRSDAAECGV